MGLDQIPEVENGLSINDLIKEVNSIISGWTDIYQPITKGRTDSLDATGMKDKKGANIQHALMGLIVTMVSDLNMTIEDIKKSITITTESPFIQVATEEKYMKIYESIKEWIIAYVDVGGKTVDFIEKIEAIPDKA